MPFCRRRRHSLDRSISTLAFLELRNATISMINHSLFAHIANIKNLTGDHSQYLSTFPMAFNLIR